MIQYLDMLAKVVVGKSRHRLQRAYTLTLSQAPASIRGAWLTNHAYTVRNNGANAEIAGGYDLEFRYACADGAPEAGYSQRFAYSEEAAVDYRSRHFVTDNGEIICRVVGGKFPAAESISISPGSAQIAVAVEIEFLIEVISETRVCVAVDTAAAADGLRAVSPIDLRLALAA